MYCKLTTRGRSPFFILNPLKEEVISLEPVVTILYDIILPSEIILLQKLARTKLTEARVINDQNQSGPKVNLLNIIESILHTG